MKLIAHPLKVRVLLGNELLQSGEQQAIVFLKCFQDRAGGQVQLDKRAAVIFHLLDKFQRSVFLRQAPGGRSWSYGDQCRALFGFESEAAEAGLKLTVDALRLWLKKPGEPLQLNA